MIRRIGRRRRIFPRRRLPWPLWVLLVLASLVAWYARQTELDQPPFRFDPSQPYRVERVVDGDTLVLAGGTRIRLIGVDTPETKHPDKPVDPLGLEAAEFVRRHIGDHQIRLKFDKERRDRYDRVLAYVYRWNDDWFLNEELVLAGYSRAVTRYPYSNGMKRRFREAEAVARERGRGVWARER